MEISQTLILGPLWGRGPLQRSWPPQRIHNQAAYCGMSIPYIYSGPRPYNVPLRELWTAIGDGTAIGYHIFSLFDSNRHRKYFQSSFSILIFRSLSLLRQIHSSKPVQCDFLPKRTVEIVVILRRSQPLEQTTDGTCKLVFIRSRIQKNLNESGPTAFLEEEFCISAILIQVAHKKTHAKRKQVRVRKRHKRTLAGNHATSRWKLTDAAIKYHQQAQESIWKSKKKETQGMGEGRAVTTRTSGVAGRGLGVVSEAGRWGGGVGGLPPKIFSFFLPKTMDVFEDFVLIYCARRRCKPRKTLPGEKLLKNSQVVTNVSSTNVGSTQGNRGNSVETHLRSDDKSEITFASNRLRGRRSFVELSRLRVPWSLRSMSTCRQSLLIPPKLTLRQCPDERPFFKSNGKKRTGHPLCTYFCLLS